MWHEYWAKKGEVAGGEMSAAGADVSDLSDFVGLCRTLSDFVGLFWFLLCMTNESAKLRFLSQFSL
jgi:D-lyxose ketol-isomerase